VFGIDATLGIGVVLYIALKGILAFDKLRIALAGVDPLSRADPGVVFQIIRGASPGSFSGACLCSCQLQWKSIQHVAGTAG
jgi:hypothetical protein